jgi:hypothetical protein
MTITDGLLMFFTLGALTLSVGVTIGAAIGWLRRRWR